MKKTRCDACRVYEATSTTRFLELEVELCRSCLRHFRVELKQTFKRQEEEFLEQKRRRQINWWPRRWDGTFHAPGFEIERRTT